jgi:CDP-diacylglycerol--serine O-phosphatidyltransferase
MLGVITTIVALLMVSNFTFFSPKQLNFKGRVPFVTLVLVVLAFAVLLVDPPRVLLAMAAMYALSGPLQYSWQWLKKRNKAEA